MKKLGGLVLIIVGLMISAAGGAESKVALLSGIIVTIVGLITTWSAESKK